MPPPIPDLINTTPQTFGHFSLCLVDILQQAMHRELQIKLQFTGTYPILVCTKSKKIFNVFLFPFWTLLTLICDLLHPCDFNSIPQKIPFKSYITCGLPVHSYQFTCVEKFGISLVVQGLRTLPNLAVVTVCIFACTQGNTEIFAQIETVG